MMKIIEVERTTIMSVLGLICPPKLMLVDSTSQVHTCSTDDLMARQAYMSQVASIQIIVNDIIDLFMSKTDHSFHFRRCAKPKSRYLS
jgi:hypothetical protein